MSLSWYNSYNTLTCLHRLNTLVIGLTKLRHDEWIDMFDVGLFMSFARFVNPELNLHLSFTTITLYSELLATHPNFVCIDQIFGRVMKCFLAEKDELCHACARFILEANKLYPEKLRNQESMTVVVP